MTAMGLGIAGIAMAVVAALCLVGPGDRLTKAIAGGIHMVAAALFAVACVLARALL